jgi:hypothetical protein
MRPKSAKRLTDDIMRPHIGIDPDEFGSGRSKFIETGRRDAAPKVTGLSRHFVILWHAG